MFDSPTGIEQIIPLVGDMDLDTEIIVGCQEVDDLVSQMMNVDGYLVKAGIFQFEDYMSSIGFPLIGSNAFGVLSVSGLRRVPKPAAKIIAFIILS